MSHRLIYMFTASCWGFLHSTDTYAMQAGIANHEGIQTLNLLIRSQTPCPLGHVVMWKGKCTFQCSYSSSLLTTSKKEQDFGREAFTGYTCEMMWHCWSFHGLETGKFTSTFFPSAGGTRTSPFTTTDPGQYRDRTCDLGVISTTLSVYSGSDVQIRKCESCSRWMWLPSLRPADRRNSGAEERHWDSNVTDLRAGIWHVFFPPESK